MRTIVHIGQHKTGTTSLQHYLKNDKQYLIKQGLYVPEGLAGFDDTSHFMLNLYALEKERMSPLKETFEEKSPERMKGLFNQMRKDINDHYLHAKDLECDSVIWSNEGLYLLNSIEEYQSLFGLFAEHSSSTICVCCFRDVSSYRNSYQQQLKSLGIKPSENIDSYRYTQSDSWLFDYAKKTQLLNSVFNEVLTFDYEPADNVAAFLRRTGYDDKRALGHPRLNVTGLTR